MKILQISSKLILKFRFDLLPIKFSTTTDVLKYFINWKIKYQ